MATTADYLTQLQADKQTLVDNLVAKGVNATNKETFTSLVPKVAEIQSGGGSFEITDASYLFNSGARLDIVNELCAALSPECTNYSNMFIGVKIPSLPSFNCANGINFSYMCYQAQNLITFPEINTGNAENMGYMCYNCQKLQTFPLLDCGKVTNISSVLHYCIALTTLGGFKDLGKAYTKKTTNYSEYTLKLSDSTLLTHDSLMNVINNLYDLNLTYNVANGGTLYTQSLIIAAECQSLLTEAELAIAANKGWNVSFA